MNSYDVYRGDTGPVIRARPSILDDGVLLDGNWKCYASVKDSLGNIVIDKYEITAKTGDGLRFQAVLGKDRTILLPVRGKSTKYVWAVELLNPTTSPPFNIEKHFELNVHEQGVLP